MARHRATSSFVAAAAMVEHKIASMYPATIATPAFTLNQSQTTAFFQIACLRPLRSRCYRFSTKISASVMSGTIDHASDITAPAIILCSMTFDTDTSSFSSERTANSSGQRADRKSGLDRLFGLLHPEADLRCKATSTEYCSHASMQRRVCKRIEGRLTCSFLGSPYAVVRVSFVQRFLAGAITREA